MKRLDKIREEIFDILTIAANDTKLQAACLRCDIEWAEDRRTILIVVRTPKARIEKFRVLVQEIIEGTV